MYYLIFLRIMSMRDTLLAVFIFLSLTGCFQKNDSVPLQDNKPTLSVIDENIKQKVLNAIGNPILAKSLTINELKQSGVVFDTEIIDIGLIIKVIESADPILIISIELLQEEINRKTHKKFLITATYTDGGVVTPSNIEITANSSAQLKVTLELGFTLNKISGCNGKLDGLIYHISEVVNNCSIEASFIKETEGRLMISFDDYMAKGWWEYAQPIFDKYAMPAIYYINPYLIRDNKLEEYIELLRSRGNVIGHHSCSHQNAKLYKGDYVQNEILECLHLFGEQKPTIFAYPFGDANAKTEEILTPYFKNRRWFSMVWNNPTFSKDVGISIDAIVTTNEIDFNWNMVWNAIDKASEEGLTLHLSSHKVVDNCEIAQQLNWAICADDLDRILDYAQNKGLILGHSEKFSNGE